MNPATGEVLKNFTEHTDGQMWNALAIADKAFRSWSSRPFSERSKIIGRSAQILLEKKKELARLATWEMGKRLAESRGEVELSASIMQYFADNAESFLAPKKLQSVMGDARLEYSPSGVLLSIQPLELYVLSVGSLCRSAPDVRQCDASQTRAWRSAMCISL